MTVNNELGRMWWW